MLIKARPIDLKRIHNEISTTYSSYKIMPIDDFCALFSTNEYFALLYIEDDVEKGFVVGCECRGDDNYKGDGYFFMDYFLIYPAWRGKGSGRKMLSELRLEPFAKHGILFETPIGDTKATPPFYPERISDPCVRLKRFLDLFNQTKIAHVQGEDSFAYSVPTSNGSKENMELHFLSGTEPKRLYYRHLTTLVTKTQSFIHQGLPNTQSVIDGYRNTLNKTTDPTHLLSIDYSLQKASETIGDAMATALAHCFFSGNRQLMRPLFGDDIYNAKRFINAGLSSNTIFNRNNIYLLVSNGMFLHAAALIIDKAPESNDLESLFEAIGVPAPKTLDKAKHNIEKIVAHLEPNKSSIVFLAKEEAPLEYEHEMGVFLQRLPRNKTYLIEADTEYGYISLADAGYRFYKENGKRKVFIKEAR